MEEHLYILTVFPFFFWLTYHVITQLTFLVGPDHQITQHTKLYGMKWEKHTLELSISVVFSIILCPRHTKDKPKFQQTPVKNSISDIWHVSLSFDCNVR